MSPFYSILDHSFLVKTLRLMGVQEHAACWMESYMLNRSQSTLVDGYLSSDLLLFSDTRRNRLGTTSLSIHKQFARYNKQPQSSFQEAGGLLSRRWMHGKFVR